MARLAVIGNISVDHINHPGYHSSSVGGAALHIALAAATAGMRSAPVAVIGNDLRWLLTDQTLAVLDWSGIGLAHGTSAAFTLTYDTAGDLTSLHADHGAAATGLTRHALGRIAAGRDDAFHVCCRTPLNIGRILDALAARNAMFSADFILSSTSTAIPAAVRHLPHAQIVFVNSAEYEAVSRAALIEDLPAVVVSDGPRTARLYRHNKLTASADPPQVAATRVTGAGDSLAGTFLAAAAAGLHDHDALRLAVTAASAHTTSQAITVR